ncbi:hypothetical protein D3C76_1855460 [compost metagenome]
MMPLEIRVGVAQHIGAGRGQNRKMIRMKAHPHLVLPHILAQLRKFLFKGGYRVPALQHFMAD